MSSASTNIISASASLAIFSILTCVYFLLRYLFVDGYKKNNSTLSYLFTGFYIILAIGAQFGINFKNSKEHCGEPQFASTFIYTVLPNFTIFCLIMLLLFVFPGWRAPFANTFGYAVAWVLGVKGIFNNMLPAKSGNKLIQQVCEDSSTFINEITPENFDAFIGRMRQNKLLSSNADQYIPQLYNMVMLKDNIAKLIWYLLTGCLVISTSYNAIMGIQCERSSAKLEEKQKQWATAVDSEKTKPLKQFAVTD